MSGLRKKILVAEDEEMLNDLLSTLFREEGFKVDSAADGEIAWNLCNNNHYDLLVTDLFMPNMNGIELIVKCQQTFPDLKIMLISGGGRNVDAEHGSQSVTFQDQQINIDKFLRKPCDLDEIIGTVTSLLEG